MNFPEDLLAGILIAALITAIFYYGFNVKGPWGSFWTFFILLFFMVWAASVWVRPTGPEFWGVAWFPLIFIGLLFALLLAAMPSHENRHGNRKEKSNKKDKRLKTAFVGWIFWAFLTVLIISLILGYLG